MFLFHAPLPCGLIDLKLMVVLYFVHVISPYSKQHANSFLPNGFSGFIPPSLHGNVASVVHMYCVENCGAVSPIKGSPSSLSWVLSGFCAGTHCFVE